MRALRQLLLLLVIPALLGGCGVGSPAASGGRLRVVAAENFWGSIATQLGGDRVQVTSIVTSPGSDPHEYEPTARDARAFASAEVAIVNGIGYDPWASKLISANPVDGRRVITVGDVVGIQAGGNPHRWYSPSNVDQAIDAITAAYKQLDPGHASYFSARRNRFETEGLAQYHDLIASIRRRYAGVPVGASESVVEPLAASLGLRLLTPLGFMNAISEGAEPTAADKSTVDRQIAQRQIRVWIYNSQNATPDVKRLTDEARANGLQVVGVTETLTPASASFEDWQSRELGDLAQALEAATGR